MFVKILRLRQTCVHPSLIKLNTKETLTSWKHVLLLEGYVSSKMSKVATLVEEIMKENEKVVTIVSQWVKVLELFEKRFLKDGIKYDFIDGSVSYDDRSSMTLNFNETTDGPSVSFLFRMLSCFI